MARASVELVGLGIFEQGKIMKTGGFMEELT